jgi:hypothetical protein
LNSDTDQKNLDFVEQESGVKQERDLQKQSEAAKQQVGLKVLDHHLGQNAENNSAIRDYVTAKKE